MSMPTRQSGFTMVAVIVLVAVLVVIGVIGWSVWRVGKNTGRPVSEVSPTSSASHTTGQIKDSSDGSEYAGWKSYRNTQLSISLKYPGTWQVVDDSDNLGTLVRFQAPGYIHDNGSGGYSGTEVSVMADKSHTSYATARQDAESHSSDLRDFTVAGKPAFGYTKLGTNETGYSSYTVKVDTGAGKVHTFLYQSNTNTVPQQYDTADMPIFDLLIKSVIFR